MPVSEKPWIAPGRPFAGLYTGAPPAWTPARLSTLVGWWSAKSGVTVDGSTRVSQWNDKSGNGWHWTQATAGKRPLYEATGGSGGNACINFDGSVAVRSLESQIVGLTAAEVWVVVKLNADPPTAALSGLWKFCGGVTNFPYSDGVIYEGFGNASYKTIGNPTPSLASWRRYNVGAATNLYQASLDAATLYTSTVNTFNWKIPAQLPCVLGTDAGVYTLNGRICEMVLIGSYATADERANVDTYLKNEWGL